MYVISENEDGNLTNSNASIKNNLKVWLNQGRMINDTIDILDAKIINIGIEFVITGDIETNRFLLLDRANEALRDSYNQKFDIGEPFFITEVFKTLQAVQGVVDVNSVRVVQKSGANYSSTYMDLDSRTSADGKYIDVPKNVVMEIKFPDADIVGSVK